MNTSNKKKIINFLNIFIFIIFSWKCYDNKETLYVSDFQGMYVYENMELSSKVIYRVPYKASVDIYKTEDTKWRKVVYKNIVGYSYSPITSMIQPEDSLFVDSLDGLGIYEKPTEKSKLLALFVHKTKLKVINIDQGDNILRKLLWAYVEGENLKGFVQLDFLSQEPRTYFYSIVNSAGVNLRSKPGVNSPVITVLPMNTIGEILEKSGEFEMINDSKGYWFRTDYKGKIGWIFSGYTVTSRDRRYLEDRDYIRNEEWFMRYMDTAMQVDNYSFNEKDLKDLKVKVIEKNNYEIFEINYGHSGDDCSINNNSRIVFKNKNNGKAYSIQGLYSESIISVDTPFPNTIYSSYSACNCCCPDDGNILYYLFDDRVEFIHYKNEDTVAACLYGSVEGIELQRENRFDFENKIIYMNLKLPLCEAPTDFVDQRVPPKGIAHNLFALVKLQNNIIIIEKYYDKGIPEKYLDSWEMALGFKQQK
jgi:hypothetical protein